MNDTTTNEFNGEHPDGTPLMPIGEHLEELRKYLIRIIIALLLVFVALFSQKDFLFDGIILAPKNPEFITNRAFCKLSHLMDTDILCMNATPLKLINIQLAGQFSAHILITLIAAFILSFPYTIWQLWLFLKPALYDTETKNLKSFTGFTTLLFLSGISFGYFMIVPITINFLGSYTVSEEVTNQIALMSYVSTVTLITLVMGLVFQLPLVVFFLTKIGIVSPEFLRKNRKLIIVIIVIVAAIITPPDAFSQILVAIPLYVLYEISITVSKRTVKKVV